MKLKPYKSAFGPSREGGSMKHYLILEGTEAQLRALFDQAGPALAAMSRRYVPLQSEMDSCPVCGSREMYEVEEATYGDGPTLIEEWRCHICSARSESRFLFLERIIREPPASEASLGEESEPDLADDFMRGYGRED